MPAKKSVSCPVETTLGVLDGRWKVLVIHQLIDGLQRFNALHRALPGISNRTLVRQLRELEADGVISRRVYAEVPPKVEYALTPLGRTLKPILIAMAQWGERYEKDVGPRR